MRDVDDNGSHGNKTTGVACATLIVTWVLAVGRNPWCRSKVKASASSTPARPFTRAQRTSHCVSERARYVDGLPVDKPISNKLAIVKRRAVDKVDRVDRSHGSCHCLRHVHRYLVLMLA